MRGPLALAGAVAGLAAFPALADPCRAIPDKGPLPAFLKGRPTFAGPVAYIGDGDSLCVAIGKEPSQWVEVRLADFYAPELHAAGGAQAKAALHQIAFGRRVTCHGDHRSYDRMVARCELGGASLGDLMRRAGVEEAGRGR